MALVVAILTEVGHLLHQEPLVDAAVGRVARGAVLVNRGMLKHIRTPLLRVTRVTELVDARGLDHRGIHVAVRLVAVGAGDPAFHEGVVGPPVEPGLDVEVTLAAYLVFPCGRIAEAGQGGAVAGRGLRRPVQGMAIAARHIHFLVRAGIPHGELRAVLVAGEAYPRFPVRPLAFRR